MYPDTIIMICAAVTALWFFVGGVVAVVVGRSIRLADSVRESPDPALIEMTRAA